MHQQFKIKTAPLTDQSLTALLIKIKEEFEYEYQKGDNHIVFSKGDIREKIYITEITDIIPTKAHLPETYLELSSLSQSVNSAELLAFIINQTGGYLQINNQEEFYPYKYVSFIRLDPEEFTAQYEEELDMVMANSKKGIDINNYIDKIIYDDKKRFEIKFDDGKYKGFYQIDRSIVQFMETSWTWDDYKGNIPLGIYDLVVHSYTEFIRQYNSVKNFFSNN